MIYNKNKRSFELISNDLLCYFILLLIIVSFTIEKIKSPIATVADIIRNVVNPAFGKVVGGSVSFNFGEISDVFDCSFSSKSL